MNIVMVAARAFPVIRAGLDLCEFMATFDRTATIHTRSAKGGPDQFIAEAARTMGFDVRTWVGEGGASNYIRDVEMVRGADVVYAFFDADHVGEGGTQHVIDKALDQGKAVVSYVFDRGLVIVGSYDSEDRAADDASGLGRPPEVSGEAAEEFPGGGSEGPEEGDIGFASGAARHRHPASDSRDGRQAGSAVEARE